MRFRARSNVSSPIEPACFRDASAPLLTDLPSNCLSLLLFRDLDDHSNSMRGEKPARRLLPRGRDEDRAGAPVSVTRRHAVRRLLSDH